MLRRSKSYTSLGHDKGRGELYYCTVTLQYMWRGLRQRPTATSENRGIEAESKAGSCPLLFDFID